MAKIEVIVPKGMLGAFDDEHPLDSALRIIGVGFGEQADWPSKYGADFENDVFLMKRYCWCEREGECPWCTGCGIYEHECLACSAPASHAAGCYREELSRRFRKHGIDYHNYSGSSRAQMGKIKRALCAERNIPFTEYLFLCDCGTDERRAAARDEQGCDYHLGNGIFEPFAPYTQVPEREYYDPPNFWLKKPDFRVTWYKYIGRSTATNSPHMPADLLEQVFASHPNGMTVSGAIAEMERQEEESRKEFERIMEMPIEEIFGDDT